MSEVNNIPEGDALSLPKGWVETTLGEVAEIGSSKRIFFSDYVSEGVPFYRSKEVIEKQNGNNISSELFITEEKFQEIDSKFGSPKKNDLLLTSVGTLGVPYLVKENEKFYFKDGNLTWFKNYRNIEPYFLYNWILSSIGKESLKKITIGSTQSALTIAGLRSIPIVLPSLPEQKSIAAILTAFDDKIELLQAQNKTLEETAQTIFKEWFGKYQIGDELPEGWRVGKLGEIASHAKDNIKPFDNSEKEYVHFSLPSYDDGLKPIIEKGVMIKSNKYAVISNSFLVSKLNPFTPRIWTIYESAENYICSTEFQVVKPISGLYFTIIHCFLNSDNFTKELSQKIKGTSSSHQRVNPQDIFDVKLIIPNNPDLIKLDECLKPIVQKKDINRVQIQTLTQTRDELLPKLMSGEIRVAE